jgi:hypothetical protein
VLEFIAFKYFSKYSARQRSPENKEKYKTLTRKICSNFQIASDDEVFFQ